MEIVADLHLHSKYSRAVSKDMVLPIMSKFAKQKGLNLLTTGDWTHPVWLKEIKVKWLSASLFIVYIVINFLAYGHYWKNLDVESKPGMAGAAKFLQTNVEPGHHVFLGTAYEFYNYK